ncbi:hypothetical protein CV093_06070 [Oceanobacillus sp. 143]|nr:hypothetical protein CV093_06070 [Oceanobacillus sp. 143]
MFILFACDENASENSTGAEDSHENEQEETEPVTVEAEAEDTEEKEEESQKETKEEVIDEDTVENLPPIPTSFAEAVDYPLTGQLAGVEFINQPEIIEVLDSFPTLTSESTEEEVEHWERYLWTLFKEDFSPVNVPIDQWESMQFSDPTAVDNEGIAVLERKETYNIAIY